EKAGLPTASLVCDGFVIQGRTTAAGLGMPNLPLAAYPGPVNLHSVEEIERNVAEVMVDQIIKGLTVQPEEAKPSTEPAPRDIVFKGTFEEVNRFFYEKEWGDGLLIAPPTLEKVDEFLKYTDRPADEVIGVLLPDKREATIWNIAVNGVMVGCRPEYMPVLVAIVEAMSDPKFGNEHLGHTPGAEVLITINGPIIKDLGFNYEQGALRVGFQANTSVGRFWRLYLRNVPGFLPHKTDKGTFGGTWRVVLAENEDALAKIGWEQMSVDQGFQAGDNVITASTCISSDSVPSVGSATAEEILNRLSARIVDIQLYMFLLSFFGTSVRPQILLSPCIAETLAKAGYSKQKVKQYFYEHAKFPAKRFEEVGPPDMSTLCQAVEEGRLPSEYCESTDPNRLVPIVFSPADFMITVSGDPGRDNCFICAQNGFIGYPVSKKIELPANWAQLLKEARKE
ncbi:UGSC family (seleno)protein, partial [Chloroflexota bacterium]